MFHRKTLKVVDWVIHFLPSTCNWHSADWLHLHLQGDSELQNQRTAKLMKCTLKNYSFLFSFSLLIFIPSTDRKLITILSYLIFRTLINVHHTFFPACTLLSPINIFYSFAPFFFPTSSSSYSAFALIHDEPHLMFPHPATIKDQRPRLKRKGKKF